MEKKFRLITRSDFDGLVCAVLLKKLDMIEEIKFVHPKDMQDGLIEVNGNDITTNLPYVEGVHLAFDHHQSEMIRGEEVIKDNHIIDPDAPSASRVLYNYFGGTDVFPQKWNDMMVAVDKADSAQFTKEEVLSPENWELLSFLMDARTGLGRFRNFHISNYNLMMKLIDYCKDNEIEDILNLPDVKERVELYFDHEERFKNQIQNCAQIYENVLVIRLKDEEIIHPGNRFVKYALFPQTNVSIQVIWGLKKQKTVFTVGKSIFNKNSSVDIGELMLKYGGGGHRNAGTCQVENDQAERILKEIIMALKEEAK